MKIKQIVILSLIPLSSLALAADGTINITGKVLDSTCKIGGANTYIHTVKLPTVIKSVFTSGVGATAGETAFQVSLTDCPHPANIGISFEASNQNITPEGRLSNTIAYALSTDSGSNVQVELLNGSSRINLTDSTITQGQSPIVALEFDSDDETTNHKNFDLKARYYAPVAYADIKSGSVATSVTYNIVYD